MVTTSLLNQGNYAASLAGWIMIAAGATILIAGGKAGPNDFQLVGLYLGASEDQGVEVLRERFGLEAADAKDLLTLIANHLMVSNPVLTEAEIRTSLSAGDYSEAQISHVASHFNQLPNLAAE